MTDVRNIKAGHISLYDPANGYFEVYIGDGSAFTALNPVNGEIERFTCGPAFTRDALFYGVTALPSGLHFNTLTAEVDIYVTTPTVTSNPQIFACNLVGGTVKEGGRVFYSREIKLRR